MAFYFGDDADMITSTLFDEICEQSGFELTTHPDEMDMIEIGRAYVVSRLMFKEARERKLSADVMREVIENHDRLFQAYCQADPRFVKHMRTGHHAYLGHMSEANQRKYWRLAGLLPEDLAS